MGDKLPPRILESSERYIRIDGPDGVIMDGDFSVEDLKQVIAEMENTTDGPTR